MFISFQSALILLRHGADELFSKSRSSNDYNFFENIQLMQVRSLHAILNFLDETIGDYWRRQLERKNNKFYTPLLAASLHGKVDLVNFLLDKGADALQIK